MEESRKRGTENRQSRDQTSNSRAAQARKRRAGQATRGTPQKKKPLTDRRGRLLKERLKERTVSVEGQRRPKKKGNSMKKVNLVLLGLIVLIFIGLFLTSRMLVKEKKKLYTLSTDNLDIGTEYIDSNAMIQREYYTVKEEYERFKIMKAEGFEKEVGRVSEEWRTVKQAFEKGPEVVNVYE